MGLLELRSELLWKKRSFCKAECCDSSLICLSSYSHSCLICSRPSGDVWDQWAHPATLHLGAVQSTEWPSSSLSLHSLGSWALGTQLAGFVVPAGGLFTLAGRAWATKVTISCRVIKILCPSSQKRTVRIWNALRATIKSILVINSSKNWERHSEVNEREGCNGYSVLCKSFQKNTGTRLAFSILIWISVMVFVCSLLAEGSSVFPVKPFGLNPNDSISQNKAWSHLLSWDHTDHAHFYGILLTIECYPKKVLWWGLRTQLKQTNLLFSHSHNLNKNVVLGCFVLFLPAVKCFIKCLKT